MAVGFAGGAGGRRAGVVFVGGRRGGRRGDGGDECASCCVERGDRVGCVSAWIFVVVLMLMPLTCAIGRRGRRSFLHDCCCDHVSASVKC